MLLEPETLKEAMRLADEEGLRLDQFIKVAMEEKLSAGRTDRYFAERAARGDVRKALEVLDRLGKSEAPVPGNEIPGR